MTAHLTSKQAGHITLFALTVLLAFSFLILTFAYKRHLLLAQYHHRFHFSLCAQKLIRSEENLIKKQSRYNQFLAGSISLSILFPGSSLSLESARKMAQSLQQMELVSYLYHLQKILQQNCPVSPTWFKSPYQTTPAGILTRNAYGGISLRELTWTNHLWSTSTRLNFSFTTTSELSSSLQKKLEWLEWRPLKSY